MCNMPRYCGDCKTGSMFFATMSIIYITQVFQRTLPGNSDGVIFFVTPRFAESSLHKLNPLPQSFLIKYSWEYTRVSQHMLTAIMFMLSIGSALSGFRVSGLVPRGPKSKSSFILTGYLKAVSGL